MKLSRSIRGKMTISYAGLILALVITFSFIYYDYASSILIERASQSLSQLSTTTNSNFDSLIRNLDSTAYRIVSSSLIKEAFYKDCSTVYEMLENKNSLMDLLFTTTGSQIENQINLIGKNGKLVEFGQKFDTSYFNSTMQPKINFKIQECLDSKGSIYISSTPLFSSTNENSTIFSVCRGFNKTFGANYDACVEIQLNYNTIAKLMDSVLKNGNTTFYIYDKYGTLIYPKSDFRVSSDYYKKTLSFKENSGTFTYPKENNNEIIAFSRSEYSGITVLACENESLLYLPITGFRNRIFIIAVLIVLFTTLIVSLTANQLTRPIRNLQKSINSLDLNHLESNNLPFYRYSTYELEDLSNSYMEMVNRLHASLNETVTARSHEIESRMLALQAQMNPHFLYNTITIIGICAEDCGADSVAEMCETLSAMLRYVTKETSGTVPLESELIHLKQYLFLMKCRYPEQFTAQISIPSEMETLIVPKLIIQPLVENSFKHGFQAKKHWEIQIDGHITETSWEIIVFDNGSGFSADTLEKLEKNFATAQGDFNPEEHDNVGLSNIFYRLKFLYREDAKFEIQNLDKGGCSITIGGTRNGGKTHEF